MNESEKPWWWGMNKVEASPAAFTLDMLKREMQRTNICALCGLAFKRGDRVLHQGRDLIHGRC